MSTLKADAVTTKSDNTDLTITGGGTGVPNLEAGFKVGGTAGVPVSGLQVGTDGELITWDASGDPATVAVGTATHLLTSNGAGAAPTFQVAAAQDVPAARARFNGQNAAVALIAPSVNVSSVTDESGVGKYSLAWTSAFSAANYQYLGSCGDENVGADNNGAVVRLQDTAETTSASGTFETLSISTHIAVDTARVNYVTWGTLA